MKTEQTPFDALIEQVKKTKGVISENSYEMEKAKEAIRVAQTELREYKRDLSIMTKYATPEQLKAIEALELDLAENGLNPIASLALEVLDASKDKKLSNEAWYKGYVAKVPKEKEALNYTEFNIKVRPLFSRNIVTRSKGSDPNNSKTDIIFFTKK